MASQDDGLDLIAQAEGEGHVTTTDRVPRCPVHDDFDPFSPEYQADPHVVFARLP